MKVIIPSLQNKKKLDKLKISDFSCTRQRTEVAKQKFYSKIWRDRHSQRDTAEILPKTEMWNLMTWRLICKWEFPGGCSLREALTLSQPLPPWTPLGSHGDDLRKWERSPSGSVRGKRRVIIMKYIQSFFRIKTYSLAERTLPGLILAGGR